MNVRSKYGNRKTEIDGHLFDSRREARRYQELRYLQRAGIIRDLQLQVPFELIPAQKINGKVVERACKYIADFTYFDNEKQKEVVEDAKGCRTEVFRIKKKLMLEKFGIVVMEV